MAPQSKIVQLGEVRSAARLAADARLPPPLLKLRDRSAQHLGQSLQKVMAKLDDSLFALADKADNNTAQQAYFDAMREIRLKKDAIISRFDDEFKAGFHAKNVRDSLDNDEIRVDSLSLLHNDELEERVAAESMVARVQSAMQRELEHLTLRMDALYARIDIEEANNPLGPQQILRSFQSGLSVLEVGIEPKLIALKLFEKLVLNLLKPLFDAANRYLAEQGVLPDVQSQSHQSRRQHTPQQPPGNGRHGGGRAPAAGPAPAGGSMYATPSGGFAPAGGHGHGYAPGGYANGGGYAPAAGGQGYAPGGNGPAGHSGDVPVLYDGHAMEPGSPVPVLTNQASSHLNYSALPAEALNLIRNLSRQGQRRFSLHTESGFDHDNEGINTGAGSYYGADAAGAGGVAGGAGQVELDHRALVGLLTEAQQQQTQLVGDHVNSHGLLSFDALLQSMLKKSEDKKDSNIASFDQDIMNLVTMLFEYILSDKQLQAPVKALIGRLQIPVLKVALLDKSFFADAEHSARRLLNTLATASMGWIEDTGLEQDPFLAKLEEIVARLLNDFVDQPAIFDEVLEDFILFRDSDKRRRQLLEQRTRDAEAGKARAEHARSQVEEALEFALRNDALTAPTVEVIRDGWCNYMVLLALKQGAQSNSWRSAIALTERLCELDLGCYEVPEDVRAILASNNESAAYEGAVDAVVAELKAGLQQTGYKPFDLEPHLGDYRDHLLRQAVEQHGADGAAPAAAKGQTPSAAGSSAATASTASATSGIVENPSASPSTVSEATQEQVQAEDTAGTTDQTNGLTADVPDNVSDAGTTAAKPSVRDEVQSQALAGSLALVRNMRIGLWIEYSNPADANASKLRCKLAAVLQTTGKYIFVNRMGVKVLERSREALAAELNDGSVTLLDDSLLFDRALEAVIGSLRNDTKH
ncbi:DUF1631 domain-containing protein [Allohahella marinimesophila]|uniref:DUF1631 domain-containing protein n=1 Tax=Allohahella marinimesophila TaxID=1054972 RepID=A0ABP7P3W1_9GAMM